MSSVETYGRGPRLLLGCIVALSLVAAGCENEEEGTPTPSPTPPAETAQVRVVHASPDTPTIDVWVQSISEPVIQNLAYTQTSDYLTVEPGTYTFEIRAAGADVSETPVFTSNPIAIAPNASITLVAAGLINSTDANESFRLLPFPERFSSVPSGNAAMRFIQAVPDLPAAAVAVGSDQAAAAQVLNRFESSAEAGLAVPSDTPIDLGLFTGTDATAALATFTTPGLGSQNQVFAIFTGLQSEPLDAENGLIVILVGDQGTLAVLRANPVAYLLHATPGAPAIDVFRGERKVVENLNFGQLSGPILLTAGSTTLDIFPYSSSQDRPGSGLIASLATPELNTTQQYLLSLVPDMFGTDQQTLQLATYQNGFADDPDNARLRAVHNSPDAPAIDMGTYDTSTGVFTPIEGLTDLSYLEASDPLGAQLARGSVVLAIAPTGTTDQVARFTVDLMADMEAYGVVIGALNPTEGIQPLSMVLIDTYQRPWTATVVNAQ